MSYRRISGGLKRGIITLAAAASAVALAACRADQDPALGGPVDPSSGGDAVFEEPAGTSLLLQIRDSTGDPIPAAAVTALGSVMPSDGAGRLLLDNLPSGRFVARVEAHGFAPASVAVDLLPGAHAGAEATLLPLGTPIAFNADTGAVLTQGNAKVSIPPGALVDADGEPVAGIVEATVVPLDPTSESLAALPGPLEGISNENGEIVGLESVFMAEVSLWQGANRLQLAPGATAKLELVLPASIAAQYDMGDTVPAWWFDLDAGYWKEEGAGTIIHSSLAPGKLAWAAEVSHFTWWSSDKPWTKKTCFNVRVVDGDGVALPGIAVGAHGVSYAGTSTPRYTSSSGEACVAIKLGGEATLWIGSASSPLIPPVPVTGSGPAGSCAGAGAPCAPLTLTSPLPQVCTPGASMPCPYTGPAGSEGIGLCKAGKYYCNGTGTAWIGCSGEVLPEPETCAIPFDEDCNGQANEGGQGCTCAPFVSTKACYTGPAGTLGVGPCAAGQRTCLASGTAYGPCEGQTLPQAETCATPVDDDCDGSTDCNGVPIWSKGYGGALEQYATSVAVDSAGNVVIVGQLFAGAVDFGGGPLVTAGQSDDIFVAKFDASGQHLWSKRFGDTELQGAQSVAVDSAGNVLVTGHFWGAVDFGGGPLVSAGYIDIFLVKFDASGKHLWSKRFGDASQQIQCSVAVDSAGNVLMTGSFYSTVDFGGGPLVSSGGPNYTIFAAKLDASGQHLWSKRFGEAGSNGSAGPIAVDSAGNALVTGHIIGTVDFGGGPLVSVGSYDAFVAKFDASGQHLWSKRFGEAGSEGSGGDIAVDGAGNALVTGYLAGPVDFGGGLLDGAGGEDKFAAKFDAFGQHVWSKRFADGNTTYGSAAAFDGTGNALIMGSFKGTLDLGGGPLTSAGGLDIIVTKFDPAGQPLWSRRAGDSNDQRGGDMTTDSAGNVLLTGIFEGSLGFGWPPPQSAGAGDIFLVKLTP